MYLCAYSYYEYSNAIHVHIYWIYQNCDTHLKNFSITKHNIQLDITISFTAIRESPTSRPSMYPVISKVPKSQPTQSPTAVPISDVSCCLWCFLLLTVWIDASHIKVSYLLDSHPNKISASFKLTVAAYQRKTIVWVPKIWIFFVVSFFIMYKNSPSYYITPLIGY